MGRVEASVRDYVTDRPGADYNAICARFGTPEQVVSAYLEELDTVELMAKIRIRRRIVEIIVAAALSAMLLWACVLGIALAEHRESVGGHFEETVTVIYNTSNVQEGE